MEAAKVAKEKANENSKERRDEEASTKFQLICAFFGAHLEEVQHRRLRLLSFI